jgi:hypothetical protein
MGIPIHFKWAWDPPASLIPKLWGCRKIGCDVMVPNDLKFCGVHACRETFCKEASIYESIYCYEHMRKHRELEENARLANEGWTFF